MKLFSRSRKPSPDAVLVQELKLVLVSVEERFLREKRQKMALEMALLEAEQRSKRSQEELELLTQSKAQLTKALGESRGEVTALQTQNKTLHDEKSKMADKAQLLQDQRKEEKEHFKMVYEAVKASYGQIKLENCKLLERIEVNKKDMEQHCLNNAKTEQESKKLREEVARLKAELTAKSSVLEETQEELEQEKWKNSALQKEMSELKDELLMAHGEQDVVTEEEDASLKEEVCSLKTVSDDSDVVEEKSRPHRKLKNIFGLRQKKNKEEKDKTIIDLRKTIKKYENADLISAEEAQEDAEAMSIKAEHLQKVMEKVVEENKELQRILIDKDKTINNLRETVEEAQEDAEAMGTKADALQKAAEKVLEENQELQRILLDKDQAIKDLEENLLKQHENQQAMSEKHAKDLAEKDRDAEELKNFWLHEVSTKSATISRLKNELAESRDFQEKFALELEVKIAQAMEEDAKTIAKLEEKVKLQERRRQEEMRGMRRVMRGLEESRREAQNRASQLAWRNIFKRKS